MSTPDYLIVLYSKYSSQCQKFMEVFAQHPVPHIKPICVDNTETRRAVEQNIRIKSVPAVLLVFPQKKVEIYEGERVCDWLLKELSAAQPAPPPPQSTTLLPSEPITSLPVIAPPPLVVEPQAPQPQQTKQRKSVQEIAAELAQSRGDTDIDLKRNAPTNPVPVSAPASSPTLDTTTSRRSVAEIAADLMKERSSV